MHTSIGAKLFICKLDYCLKVDESSNAKKNGICVRICSKFSVKSEAGHKNIVKVCLSPSNRESWHLQGRY